MVMQRKTTKAEALVRPWMQSLVHHQNFRGPIWTLRLCNVKPGPPSLRRTRSRLFWLRDRHQHWLTQQHHTEFFLKKPKVNRSLTPGTFPASCSIRIPKGSLRSLPLKWRTCSLLSAEKKEAAWRRGTCSTRPPVTQTSQRLRPPRSRCIPRGRL